MDNKCDIDNGVPINACISGFESNISESGYQKLPSGLIIQWGKKVIENKPQDIEFSIEFPNECLSLNCTNGETLANAGVSLVLVQDITTTGFKVVQTVNSRFINYIALGF